MLDIQFYEEPQMGPPDFNHSVNMESANRLLSALSLLKDNGGNLPPHYYDLNSGIPNDLASMEAECAKLQSSLRDLREVESDLQNIFNAAKYSLIVLEYNKRCLERQRGMYLLPDEVLSCIFEYAYIMPVDPQYHRKRPPAFVFSHVCRRWREVALASPYLWSSINHYQTMDQIDTYVERSKTVGMSISCSEEPLKRPLTTIGEVLVATTPHRQRWSRLTLDMAAGGPDCEPLMDLLSATTSFSQLTEMHLTSAHTSQMLMHHCPTSMSALECHCAGWSIPNLRHLHIRNVLPSLNLGKELQTCAVEINPPRHAGTPVSLDPLIRVLESSPSLTTLAINLTTGIRHFIATESDDPILLPCLESLTLVIAEEIGGNMNHRTFIQVDFLHRLKAANLKKLRIEVSGSPLRLQADIVGPFLSKLVNELRCGSSLTDVEIALKGPRTSPDIQIIFDALSDQTNLRRIIVDCDVVTCGEGIFIPYFPELQLLDIRYCDSLSEDFCEEVLTRRDEMRDPKAFHLVVRSEKRDGKVKGSTELAKVMGFRFHTY